MKRTLIQFDEETYHKVRHRAFERKQSISAVVRELVAKGLGSAKAKKFTHVEHFQSVGSGSSEQGKGLPVSERHDEALAEAYGDFIKK